MFSRLRHVFAAVFVLFLIPVCLRAQVALVVKPVQVNYLQYESVFVRVAHHLSCSTWEEHKTQAQPSLRL